jgi:hypothetical protein
LLVVGALGISSNSEAATYYICYSGAACNAGAGSGWSDGSAGNDGTSKKTAWACPRQMQGKLSAGDVVIIGDGNYTFSKCGSGNEILNVQGMHGTPQNPIIIKSENKWGAVIDGEETSPDDGDRSRYLIKYRGASNITFEAFEVKRAKVLFHGNDPRNVSHDIIFRGMKLHDCGFACIQNKGTYYNITIDSNFIYDTKDNSKHTGSHVCTHNHNLYLMGYNLTVTNNVLHSSNGGSMMTVGGFCSLSGNQDPVNFTHTIHATNNTFDGNGCDANYVEPDGSKRYNSIDFWNRQFTPQHCTDIGGIPRNFKNVRFQNNLMLNGQTANSGSEQSHFVSNTVVDKIVNPPNCTHWPWWSSSCVSGTRGDVGYLEFINNAAEVRAQNSTHQQWTTKYTDNCDECVDINVLNESGQDYRPTEKSTALIGKGLAAGAPAYDILGKPRALGSIDIGAFQLSAPGPKPNPPSFTESDQLQ